MFKVAFFTFQPHVIKLVTSFAPPEFHVVGKPIEIPDNEKTTLVKDADFMMLHGETLSEPVFKAAERLRLLQLLGMGYEKIDLSLLSQLGIPFANIAGANSEGVWVAV